MTRAIALIFVLALGAPLTAPAEEPLAGSFTAIAAPMPWPLWDSTVGHRCNAGVEPLHKTVVPLVAPSDGLLTLSAESFIGDWDLFIVDSDGLELGGSNFPQVATSTTGSERVTTLLEDGQAVGMVACNQLGAPAAEIDFAFEPFDPGDIAATIGIGDDGGASNYYDPQEVTIAAGQAVAWSVVTGSAPHTVTADDDSFRGGTVIAGTYARTFTQPGVYQFYCEFHGLPGQIGQWGRVTVTA